MTEKKLNLRQKLVEIRKNITYIQKTESGNNSRYASPAVLLGKIREGMDKYGVILKLDVQHHTVEQFDNPTRNNPKNRSFLFKSTLCYTWLDADSDEKLETDWFAVASHLSDPAMSGGSALTYYERYFMLKQFQIPTDSDDPERFIKKTKEKMLINDLQYENIVDMIKEVGADESKLLNWAKVNSLNEIKEDQYPQIVRMLESKKKEEK